MSDGRREGHVVMVYLRSGYADEYHNIRSGLSRGVLTIEID